MSELNERLWAVLSERGREAAGLTYDEAAALVRELRAGGVAANGGKISGLCIVTDRAAAHVEPAKVAASAKKGDGAKAAHASGDGKPKRTRRATKKKDA
jgi:hypothetical protein